jgi:GlpG protein
MLFMVGWLLACIFGVVSALGFGAIANAAHVGGLLCGSALGAAFGVLSRVTTK